MTHLIHAHQWLDADSLPLHAGNASTSQQQRQQLQSNPAWEASRFGDLETFIFDFLSGTAGGEGVRLKLQTPLNISQALLDAATQQVQDDLGGAKQVRDLSLSLSLSLSLRSESSQGMLCILWAYVSRECVRSRSFELRLKLQG